MIEAPDFIEPFTAWRVWKVVRKDNAYTLGSVVQRTSWAPGQPFNAECRRLRLFARVRRKRRHHAPAADCACGIYGASLDCIDYYVAEAPWGGVARVLGQVALWGTVIECEQGFRASHAYPIRIYVPEDVGEPWRCSWEEIALGLWSYGVPVEPLAARAAEATRYLAQRQVA